MASVNPIGLDIGSSSIRAVEVRRGKDDHSLTKSLPRIWDGVSAFLEVE